MLALFRPAALVLSLAATLPAVAQSASELTYTISMDPAANSNEFQVKLELPALGKEQAVYQFAATAPGTYQVMDMGRFVRKFEAFDAKGKALPSKQISPNQWQLESPEQTREIRYTIAETWDTPVQEHNLYHMCGSSLETDHALINGQTVLGYPQGWQARPLRLKLNYPKDWKAGSALVPDKQGFYHAKNYDHAVDSPILLGRLTEASTKLGDAEVALYCYSKTDQVKAKPLLNYMQKMLGAAQAFLGGQLPVKRYAFLYHFEDEDHGAWEHSYSSEYTLKERPLTDGSAQAITDMAAHEFFHIVTPLNIHSEIIQQFNFVQPTGSQHLWLYEGVTEWAAHTMQLRSGLISLDEYLTTLHNKENFERTQTDTTYSLARLGMNSFSDEGQAQYINIYQRGALTATLLDLRLLQLSGGKRGLREVLLELTKLYGPDKPFSEQNFFAEFTRMTYPEIGDFFQRYVQNAEPLPLQEYFANVGINYTRAQATGKQEARLGLSMGQRDGKIVFTQVAPELKACGIAEGDEPVAYQGIALSPNSMGAILKQIQESKPGQSYEMTIRHDGKEKKVSCKLLGRAEVKRFVFEPNPTATPAQLALRQVWMKNM